MSCLSPNAAAAAAYSFQQQITSLETHACIIWRLSVLQINQITFGVLSDARMFAEKKRSDWRQHHSQMFTAC